MTALDTSTAQRLKDAAGPGGWSEDPADIAPHIREFRNRWNGTTPLLLKPSTTQTVSRILAVAEDTGTPIVPQGGNTGLVGGQMPTQGDRKSTRLNSSH